jgi:hypothetical protein
MHALALLSVTWLGLLPDVNAREKDPPPGEPPQLWLASAARQDGKVMIQIARQEYKAPRTPDVAEAMRWEDLRQVALGQGVQAFGVDGKMLEPEFVLKALAERRGVAVFVRNNVRERPKDLTEPDAFYLAMLREGTIVLVAAGADIYPLAP